jgi:anti-sigma regulatory factor (Ser/Thr protein kinase)
MPARMIRDRIARFPALQNGGPGADPSVWPLRSYLEMGALPGAVPCARGHVRAVAREWGLDDISDTAELLASELVTNAVRASDLLTATRGLPVVRLWLASDQLSVIVHVWDASSEMPVRRQANPDASGGRGLLLVDALSTGWGCYRQAGGKAVWARVSQ